MDQGKFYPSSLAYTNADSRLPSYRCTSRGERTGGLNFKSLVIKTIIRGTISTMVRFRHAYPEWFKSYYTELHRHFSSLIMDLDLNEIAELTHKVFIKVNNGKLHQAPLTRPKFALDLGCGSGNWTTSFGINRILVPTFEYCPDKSAAKAYPSCQVGQLQFHVLPV
jgi:hypothetical protein